MRRGFKKEAEDLSIALRKELSLLPTDPLPARQLASHLGLELISPSDIPGLDSSSLTHLLSKARRNWSGILLRKGDLFLVIFNPTNSVARQESDIMHEIGHYLCNHEPAMLIKDGKFAFPLRDYNKAQEEEASWLGATLQLPRLALLWAVQQGLTNRQISEFFNASGALVQYRRRITGVDLQRGRSKRFASRMTLSQPSRLN